MKPRKCRRIEFEPSVFYFKPQGVPLRFLDEIELSAEELETMRLKNIQDLDQIKAAEKMHTSQSTFQRILSSAYKKVTIALVEGKAIKVSTKEDYKNY